MERCGWCAGNELYEAYHDQEWGKPVYDDQVHFEFMVLESAQAGLNWLTVLKKRENYRKAYDGFDPTKVSCYGPDKIEELMGNAGIVRNRKKIEASIGNAQVFLKLQEEFGSFSKYLWSFVGDKPLVNHWKSLSEVPATTAISDAIAKDLKKRGCRFYGSTIIYAHLQATGLVNDHLVSCHCHPDVK